MSDAAAVERAGRRREALSAAALLGPATLLVCLTMLAPLALLARYTLNRFDPSELMVTAVTLQNYIRFFTDPFYLRVLATTLRVSIVVTAACLLFGIPMAWRLARSESRWKSAYVMAIVLPLFIGATTRTAGWMILFAHGGMLDIASRALFGVVSIELMNTELAVIIG